jgi:hypothetical protein
MRILIAFCLALCAQLAHAAYDCFPSTWIPVPGLGTPYRTTCVAKDAAGVVSAVSCTAYDALPLTSKIGYSKAWFCQLPAMQGGILGKTHWSEQIFSVHRTDENLTIFKDALTRVLGAIDMIKQANIEVQTANVVLVAGSQKEYEYKMLRYLACKDMQTRTSWPANVTFDFPQQCTVAGACALAVPQPTSGFTIDDRTPRPSIYEVSWCGAVPQAPVPPVTTAWVTSGTSSYNTLNGALSSYAGVIAKGLVCDDTVVVRVGTVTYKHFAGASKPTIVAQCKAP